MIAIDFFSGCGGTSLGLLNSGIQPVLGIDIDPDACRSYNDNITGSEALCSDIRALEPIDIASYLETNEPILFCGCAPCQPFSNQNKQFSKDDPRAGLLGEFARFITYWHPQYVLIENVPGMQKSAINGQVFKNFQLMLKREGYYSTFDLIPAANFGVPQTRKRLVLVASKTPDYNLPQPTHGKNRQSFSVVRDWISDLPPLSAGEKDKHDPDHHAAKLSELNLKRISITPEGRGRETWPESLQLKCHKSYKGHTDVYGRLSWEKPASGLTTRCISYSNGRFGHPVQNRGISLREAACLQTFPRDFRFVGNMASRARQIGNAVPPLMSQALARSILNHYENS
ncbi:DNA cytosine methyltransferase [Vreelandella gomseomensis]|uniref:DNA (cytosine-5-)-methyltransferase n=1 Tax=Vreelandella gomseomensis TaxID=370766 RepID=A0ABU1GC56_9GAMM|nr:DNA cytosine methyltransferase [Halomonas gomseomensis]MDR5874639.1 DNA cytosine methyltransferase [Halomonas gomseomensis]